MQAGRVVNIEPCNGASDCNYTRTGRNTVNKNDGLGTVDVEAGPAPLVETSSVMLGTTITSRALIPFSEVAMPSAAAAGPGAAAGASAFILYLLGQRIADYTPGGVYDATANRTIYRNGVPTISMIGSTNTTFLPDAVYFNPSASRTREGAPAIPMTTTAEPPGNQSFTRLYHGSIDNATQIRTTGLNPNGGPTWVTRDPIAAANAIGNARYQVSQGMAQDPGIISSRIPTALFNQHFAPYERPYSGFGGEITSTEIILRSITQFNIFNAYIVR